jgi:hypothetical protein
MPIARYFLFVGGALLALLFIVDAYLPKLPAVDSASMASPAADIPAIRIHSDRKWPERVEFDTSQPTVTPVRTAEAAVPATVADVAAPVHPREAFAEVQMPKKPDLKQPPKRRAVARNRVSAPTILVAQQPRFGFFGHTGFFGNTVW